jgi:hypothetical protein
MQMIIANALLLVPSFFPSLIMMNINAAAPLLILDL